MAMVGAGGGMVLEGRGAAARAAVARAAARRVARAAAEGMAGHERATAVV